MPVMFDAKSERCRFLHTLTNTKCSRQMDGWMNEVVQIIKAVNIFLEFTWWKVKNSVVHKNDKIFRS